MVKLPGISRNISGLAWGYERPGTMNYKCVKYTCYKSETFYSFKVSVFNGHNSLIGKQLLGVIVDKLPGKEFMLFSTNFYTSRIKLKHFVVLSLNPHQNPLLEC